MATGPNYKKRVHIATLSVIIPVEGVLESIVDRRMDTNGNLRVKFRIIIIIFAIHWNWLALSDY